MTNCQYRIRKVPLFIVRIVVNKSTSSGRNTQSLDGTVVDIYMAFQIKYNVKGHFLLSEQLTALINDNY